MAMKTRTTSKSKRAARVRLTVACGDDLRIFEIPLRSARAAKAEEFQRAITEAAAAFSQTFSAKMKSQKSSSSAAVN
jgi:hypothetical protein